MNYFVTGSRAYGPYTEESDLDIVMSIEDSDKLLMTVTDIGEALGFVSVISGESFLFEVEIKDIEQTSYADKVWYFSVGDIKVNVISVKSDSDFECWKKTTETMKLMRVIEDKEIRVQKFKSIFTEVWGKLSLSPDYTIIKTDIEWFSNSGVFGPFTAKYDPFTAKYDPFPG